MIKWTRLLFFAAVLFGIVYFRGSSYNCVPLEFVRPQVIVSPMSTFIYRVYLDRRSGLNRLRVLAVNRCHKSNESILSVKLEDTFMPLIPRPLEGECPWHWAQGCSLATYSHEIDLPTTMTQRAIQIKGEIDVEIKDVQLVTDSAQKRLTICIPPLYWYIDWTKLIFFIEWWKSQEVSHFIFYHQSYALPIKHILDYYVNEGLATVVGWPLLPTSENYDPNDQVYRISHSLAQNDCLLRAKTEYVAVVDIDEIILPNNGNLLKMLSKEFYHPLIGSLLFAHRVLLFNPPLAPYPFQFKNVLFDGVRNTTFKNITGPPKSIVRRNVVDRISTHTVISFLHPRYTQNMTSEGLLLHSRYNYVGVQTKDRETPIKIIAFPDSFQRKLTVTRNKIVKIREAHFNEEIQRILGICLARWRSTQNNCKAPVTGCRNDMFFREVWIEATNTPFVIV